MSSEIRKEATVVERHAKQQSRQIPTGNILPGYLTASALAISFHIFAYGLAFFVYFGYFILLEGVAGITIGKLLTGTRVVDAAGGQPRLGQILGRTASRIIPFEPLSFLFGDKTTGWHDSLSGTRVVDTRR